MYVGLDETRVSPPAGPLQPVAEPQWHVKVVVCLPELIVSSNRELLDCFTHGSPNHWGRFYFEFHKEFRAGVCLPGSLTIFT